ncbi:MAG: hypothetical protein EBV82_07885, partial [Chitinophagia bacterium]|nr:hypothetical protein [Chitinophagia bacterium]
RNLFLIEKYQQLTHKVPVAMSICVAAFFVYQEQLCQQVDMSQFAFDTTFKDSVHKVMTSIQQNGIQMVVNEFINNKA